MTNRELKKSISSEDDGLASWSNLNHDMLLFIMMRVGVFDFIAFSGVCKSWRSVAVSNRKKFMVSRQPMKLTISTHLNKNDLYLEDYERRRLKTTIPQSTGAMFVGVTCGYLIFYGKKTHDFWLVNPFTRKQLHFPGFPFGESIFPGYVMGILVFSPSLAGWVFVVSHKFTNVILFSLAGEHARWRSISSSSNVRDLHFFKGKIYMINDSNNQLWELRLNPEPTLTLLKLESCPWPYFYNMEFVSSCERLYVRDILEHVSQAIEVDFDEMKWVNAESTIREYAVFSSVLKCDAAIKPDTWAHPWAQYDTYNFFQSTERNWLKLWYFPHDCLNDNDSDTEHGALLNILKE